jgi:amino acid transporter
MSHNNTLRKNAIGLKENMFQGVAGAAPAGAAVATLTGVALFAQGALPLTAIIAFLIVFLNAYIVSRISLKVSGAGGYYEYVKRGHGPSVALFTGFFYLFYQVMALSFISLSIAVFVPAILSSVFGINVPFVYTIPLIGASLLYGFFISYRGIKISTVYTMIMAIIEILTIVALGAFILLSHPSINNPSVFTLKYSSGGITGVVIGVLFMYTAFAGFGASTPLGEESTNPKKTISKSILFSVVVLGLFFVYASYVFTVAWGPAKMTGYASALVPGIAIFSSYIGIGAAIFITVLFINSLLTGIVVVTNATSRVLMSLGRDNLAPSFLASSHKKYSTPYVSAGVIAVSAFIISSVSTLMLGGFTAFVMVAIGATLGVLFVHIIINSSYPRINKRFDGRYGPISILLSTVSIVIFGFILYSTFLSINSSVIIGTLSFVAWSVITVIYTFLKRKGVRDLRISLESEVTPAYDDE